MRNTFVESKKITSLLGLGTLRLPTLASNNRILDLVKIKDIITEAQKLGINFIDTAYLYHAGQSEVAIGLALEENRDKWVISTKFYPAYGKPGDLLRTLEEQLERLNTSYIDYYSFHGINKGIFDNYILPMGFLKEMEMAREQGLVKQVGFSFHDIPENMSYIINKGEIFEHVICQYNVLCRENEQAIINAKNYGLKIICMGPMGGEFLNLPQELIDKCNCSSSAEVLLRFVMENPNIDIILSGVNSVEQLQINMEIIHRWSDNPQLKDKTISKMIQNNQISRDYYCTGCRYCTCIKGIEIPFIYIMLNQIRVLNKLDLENMYSELKIKPSECINCGYCEERCPQKLHIQEDLKKAVKLFDRKG